MEKETEFCTVVVLEHDCSLVARQIDQDTLLTIIALVSEDPSTWQEAKSVWNRYRTPVVCKVPSELPFHQIERSQIMDVLNASVSWMVIDFESKRILKGGDIIDVDRDALFAMESDEYGRGVSHLAVHLPPWWELHEDASTFRVTEPRQNQLRKPLVNRDILYGDAFFTDVAQRALRVTIGPEWQVLDREQRDYDSMTVELHRDWLMTPRSDLGGDKPRDLLHGAIQWIDDVTRGQQTRYEYGTPMIAAPNDWPSYATDPMGSQEMCMYFSYCREAIRLAWVWCLKNDIVIETQPYEEVLAQLVGSLRDDLKVWMTSPYEEGPSPNFTIECDRRRVPVGQGVSIEGIDADGSNVHANACDCPICAMLKEGLIGPSFSRFDGHHLELDGEFAFSMLEDYDEWESEYGEFVEDDEADDEEDDGEAEVEEQNAENQRSGPIVENPFASAWTGIRSDRPLPGDRKGHLRMAFMVAEIMADLSPHSKAKFQAKKLNDLFIDYRQAEGRRRKKMAKKLKSLLESIAKSFPKLVSKSADLQSCLDETDRIMITDQRDTGFRL